MAPQAAPHRRGGVHRVKDENKTNTIFDEYDYKALKSECIARGVYVKDMKKVEMARTLAKNEREKKEAEREAIIERARKQQQLEREKQEENNRRLKADAEKHRKRIERQARRDKDESVSDETPDEEEIQAMYEMYEENNDDHVDQGPVGRALSEESWDSTSTESSFYSSNRAIFPGCKLRLFEWTYVEPPSPVARIPGHNHGIMRMWIRGDPICPRTGEVVTAMGERVVPVPRNVAYAPLKLHTTKTFEKLFLPGQTYPPGVEPDYVPILSRQTRHAARNGVLEGVLCKAIIEPATVWADRTQVQGWNARMFFHLPARNEEKRLIEVYEKWYLENRRLLRVKPKGDGSEVTRKQRHDQRHRNKGKKLVDVLDASEYRVPAMCYLPSYLDYALDKWAVEDDIQHEEVTLENLFYIRFPGCDVPHYYFWTRKGEWADPTTPNPDWTPEMAMCVYEKEKAKGYTPRSRLSGKRLTEPPQPTRQIFIRVKKPITLSPPSSPVSLNLATITSHIEHELFAHGLSTTLAKYRTKWLTQGNEHAWQIFSQRLPLAYPSGAMASVPPVDPFLFETSIAEKLAIIEFSSENTQALPLTGDEPWTTNDNEWWDIVQIDNETPIDQDLDTLEPADLEPLYRRASVQTPLKNQACESWLEQISPSYVPLTPGSLPASPTLGRGEWKSRGLQHDERGRGMNVVCPFCMEDVSGLEIEEQVEHMYSHSSVGKERGRDAGTVEYLPIAPPSSIRRRRWMDTKCNEVIDAGAEGDNEQTTMKKQGKARIPTRTKRKRLEQIHHGNPSPSRHDDLQFLAAYADKKAWSSLSVEVGGGQKENRRRQTALDRKTSKTLEPAKKRRKIADPTYHDSPLNSSDEEVVPAPKFDEKKSPKKRKKITDSTYRDDHANSFDDDEEHTYHSVTAPPTLVMKKRRKIANPTYRDTSTSFEDEKVYDSEVKTMSKKRRKVVDTSFLFKDVPSSSNGEKDVRVSARKRKKGSRCAKIAIVGLLKRSSFVSETVEERRMGGGMVRREDCILERRDDIQGIEGDDDGDKEAGMGNKYKEDEDEGSMWRKVTNWCIFL